MERQRRPTAVHEIVLGRVAGHLEVAKRMLNFLTPHNPCKSPFSWSNYFKGRREVLNEVTDLGLARLGRPESRYEYIILTDKSFEPVFGQVGIESKDVIVTDPELAAAIRLENWLRYGGPYPLIIEPLRESNSISN